MKVVNSGSGDESTLVGNKDRKSIANTEQSDVEQLTATLNAILYGIEIIASVPHGTLIEDANCD